MRTDAYTLASEIRRGQRSSVELTEQTLRRIASENPKLNAFTEVTAERALLESAAVDDAVRQGNTTGPLAGVPYAVKNLFDIAGMVTRAGSIVTRSNPPANEDATVVARLKQAGAVLVGTTNMDEFAYGYTTENAHDGDTRNPHDLRKIAGGSSGGSAAAVAAGLVPFALGTDTNGSIRVPSALCGVYGLKPTFGRVSRAGVFPFVHTLDHAGPMAATLRDLALVYDVLQGHDPRDQVSALEAADPIGSQTDADRTPLRYAIADDYFTEGLTDDVAEAVQRAAAILGADRSISIPEPAAARSAAFMITAFESGRLHLPQLQTRAGEYGILVRDRLLAGALAPTQWYRRAQEFCRWHKQQMGHLFKDVDVLIAPVTPFAATTIGQDTITIGNRELPLRAELGRFVQPLTPLGVPILTVPTKQSGSLPVGIQLIGKWWQERDLFHAASILDRAGFSAALYEVP